MAFPFIIQMHVKDNFAHQNFNIPSEPLKEFKHIILTGKNGSGKTTILKRIFTQINEYLINGRKPEQMLSIYQSQVTTSNDAITKDRIKDRFRDFDDLNIAFQLPDAFNYFRKDNNYVFAFFKAHRKVEVQEVTSVTTEKEFFDNIKIRNTDAFGRLFKQYLVNKKIYEAFDFMEKKEDKLSESRLFFEEIVEIFRNIFNDKNLHLQFHQEFFEFYIVYSDGRKITFNQLSEGFSAFISILMELLIKVDLIRKEKRNYQLQPHGIVLIDEPETHFHIEMQYEILPMLTKLFPNIQFLIATHSPAVISSIKNACVMDLSSKLEISGEQVGSSFSELMVRHFGLDNEFSPIADKIILDINVAVTNKDINALKTIIDENEKFLTPSLKFEIENQIIAIESRR